MWWIFKQPKRARLNLQAVSQNVPFAGRERRRPGSRRGWPLPIQGVWLSALPQIGTVKSFLDLRQVEYTDGHECATATLVLSVSSPLPSPRRSATASTQPACKYQQKRQWPRVVSWLISSFCWDKSVSISYLLCWGGSLCGRSGPGFPSWEGRKLNSPTALLHHSKLFGGVCASFCQAENRNTAHGVLLDTHAENGQVTTFSCQAGEQKCIQSKARFRFFGAWRTIEIPLPISWSCFIFDCLRLTTGSQAFLAVPLGQSKKETTNASLA